MQIITKLFLQIYLTCMAPAVVELLSFQKGLRDVIAEHFIKPFLRCGVFYLLFIIAFKDDF